MRVGDAIRNFRENQNMSRSQVQVLSGVNFRYLGEVERSESVPSIETLQKISSAFHITVSELIGETEPTLTPELKTLLDSARELSPGQLQKLSEFIKSIK